MKAVNEKSAKQMYDDLAGVQEGGSIYTLQRPSPFHVEYIERVSRSSRRSADETTDRTSVYLTTDRGTEYRMVVDCRDDRVAMEIRDGDGWRTYSNDLSGFRYRSPGHPENGKKWQYDGK